MELRTETLAHTFIEKIKHKLSAKDIGFFLLRRRVSRAKTFDIIETDYHTADLENLLRTHFISALLSNPNEVAIIGREWTGEKLALMVGYKNRVFLRGARELAHTHNIQLNDFGEGFIFTPSGGDLCYGVDSNWEKNSLNWPTTKAIISRYGVCKYTEPTNIVNLKALCGTIIWTDQQHNDGLIPVAIAQTAAAYDFSTYQQLVERMTGSKVSFEPRSWYAKKRRNQQKPGYLFSLFESYGIHTGSSEDTVQLRIAKTMETLKGLQPPTDEEYRRWTKTQKSKTMERKI